MVVGAFALASVASVSCAFWYQARILPGVRIYTIPVGGLTVDEAVERIDRRFPAHAVTLTDGARSWRVAFKDLGVGLDARIAAALAFDVGRRSGVGNAVSALVLHRPVSVPIALSPTMFRERLAALARSIGAPPKDAALVYRNGAFAVIPDEDGIVIDVSKARSDVMELLAGGRETPVAVTVRLASAAITADMLAALRPDAERISRDVSVTARMRTYTIAKDTLAGWLTAQGSGDDAGNEVASIAAAGSEPSVTLDLASEAVAEYLDAVAKDVYVAPKPQRMLKSLHNSVVLESGTPGIMLAAGEAAGVLRATLMDPSSGAIALPTVEVPFDTLIVDPPPAPVASGKLIAVDLTRQIEYDYEDGALTYATLISSGLHDWTPTGTFKVLGKTKKQKMSGRDYYVPNVPHILWFKAGGYSLHGVYWHNDFGIRPRSHGCVGEPLDAAEWIYNWADVGTPVVIYKS